MSDLITYDSPLLQTLPIKDIEVGMVREHIAVASHAIERYCNRIFAKGNYVELCRSYGSRYGSGCFVRNVPIISVDRICVETQPLLSLTYGGAAEIATVNTTSEALRLMSITSGVKSTTELAYADYPSLTSLVNALPSGWTGDVESGYTGYPSADIVAEQHFHADEEVDLEVWLDTGDYRITKELGFIETNGACARVSYCGGFERIPEDIAYVCASLVKHMYDDKALAVASESLGEYSYSIASNYLERLPLTNIRILNGYRIVTVGAR